MVDSKKSFIPAIKNAIVLAFVGLCLSFVLPLYSAVSNNDLFVEKAYATTGWTQDGSYWYYYLSNGQPASGWQHIYHSNQWDYYYFESGRMKTGWFVWDGSWFYCADYHGQDVGFFDVDYGTCRMGWQEIYHSTGYWDWYYLWVRFRSGKLRVPLAIFLLGGFGNHICSKFDFCLLCIYSLIGQNSLLRLHC